MTTIASNDGVIAYDSRQNRNDRVASDNDLKCRVLDGARFFLA